MLMKCLKYEIGNHSFTVSCAFSATQSCLTLCNLMYYSLCPWDSPGKNTGVGFYALLQGIFTTQGLKS